MGVPLKAPPPAAPPPLDWHGFFDVTWESYDMNPQGQAVFNQPSWVVAGGLALTVYKDPNGFFNNLTLGTTALGVFSGAFNSVWDNWGVATGGVGSNAGALGYDAVIPNATLTFAKYWTLNDELIILVFGPTIGANSLLPGNGANCTAAIAPKTLSLGCGAGGGIQNDLKLTLNDGAISGWPISFNPYVTWVYEASSFAPGGNGAPDGQYYHGSIACFACLANTSDFMLGITPTVNLAKYWGIPITLKAPIWATVGQQSYWGVNSNGNWGVFTAGLEAIWDLNWMPKSFGGWYIKGGFQWYDILNSALYGPGGANWVTVGGNLPGNLTGGLPNGTPTSITVGYVGVGAHF
jgi:hypothetical protein